MACDEELMLDLAELKQLENIAKRPRVISLISTEIQSLKKLSHDKNSEQSSQTPAQPSAVNIPTPIASVSKTASNSFLNYATLDSFSWDQDSNHLKIYISLEGVDEEKMETDFKPLSFDVKFHDVKGKHYRCAVPKLHKEILPEKCKITVKPKRVVITLCKASNGNWLDIRYKEDKMKPNLEKDRDPMAGIMDLMKNMYEEGDAEMKQTIAKAWTDARSGKAADPLNKHR